MMTIRGTLGLTERAPSINLYVGLSSRQDDMMEVRMSDLKARMAALTGGGATDVKKMLARSPAEAGGGHGGGALETQSRVDRQVGLG